MGGGGVAEAGRGGRLGAEMLNKGSSGIFHQGGRRLNVLEWWRGGLMY